MEKKWYKLINWKTLAIKIYEEVRPLIESKVQNTESKWDDIALNAIDTLVNKFLK